MAYFRGIAAPDEEPRRNKYSEKKSKFTEEVAATVVDGDLYFSMRAPAHQRFYVPVEPGEHGVPEDADGTLLCVTHKYSKRWEDLPGKWESYDSGGNLVIKVRSAEDEGIVYAAMDAIESALYRTPLGRAVGHDAMRPLARSLCKAFGLDVDEKLRSTFTVNPDAERLAKDALRDLLTFAPESGYDERLGEIFAEADGVGFAENGSQYAKLINGDSDGFGGEGDGKPFPLLSQAVFYAVLGSKDDGRSFQARIDLLMQAVGLDEDDV